MRHRRIKLIDAIPTLYTNGVFAALAAYNVPWRESVAPAVLDLAYSGRSAGKTVAPVVRHHLGDDGTLSTDALDNIAEAMVALFETKWGKLWATMQAEYDPIENYNMEERETTTGTHEVTGTDTGTRGIVTDEDTTDTGTDTTRTTTTGTDTGTRTTVTDEDTTDTGTDNRTTSGTENRGIYGFNSASASNADTLSTSGTDNETRNLAGTRDTSETETRNLATSGESTETETRNLAGTRDVTETETRNLAHGETGEHDEERTLTRAGNIGVTTTQQMLTQERELWSWNYFEEVFADVDRIMCLCVY